MKTLTIEEIEQVSGAGLCKDAMIVGGAVIGGAAGAISTVGFGVGVGLAGGALAGEIAGSWLC
jgi:hypothetical protein